MPLPFAIPPNCLPEPAGGAANSAGLGQTTVILLAYLAAANLAVV